MLRLIATRCMGSAYYTCSSAVFQKQFSHYALGVPLYTHFTSPIRRYADVIVHRQLEASLVASSEGKPDFLDRKIIQERCEHLNYRSKNARNCGRASEQLYMRLYIKNNGPLIEDGVILFVKKQELTIYVPRIGNEVALFIRNNDFTKFEYDEQAGSQTAGSIVLRQFDPVKVKLQIEKRSLQQEKIAVELIHPNIPNFSVPQSEETSRKKMKFEAMPAV